MLDFPNSAAAGLILQTGPNDWKGFVMVGIHYTLREITFQLLVPEVACQALDPDMVVSKNQVSNIKQI